MKLTDVAVGPRNPIHLLDDQSDDPETCSQGAALCGFQPIDRDFWFRVVRAAPGQRRCKKCEHSRIKREAQ